VAPTSKRNAALEDLLRWYGEAGLDVALDDAPRDRLAEAAEALALSPAAAATARDPARSPGPPSAARCRESGRYRGRG
jgi:DNA polymerase